jgi:hypothetical protein
MSEKKPIQHKETAAMRIRDRNVEKKSACWSNGDEIDFLRRLGTHCVGTQQKLPLLIKYREALSLRRKWGDLTERKLRAYLDTAIDLERVKA